jgi:hypothetical protein
MKQHNSDIVTLFKTKFDHISQECESETRAKIDSIYSSIKYENGRLNVPDFNKAVNTIVGVIRLKEKRFNSEISRLFAITHGFQNAEDLQRSKELILPYFQDDQYLNRFDGFVAGVERIVSRCGGRFDRKAYRADTPAALFSVGVKNSNRRAISSLQTELDLHMTTRQPLMPDRSIPGVNDIIDVKPNIFGFGVNFNALFQLLREKFKRSRR